MLYSLVKERGRTRMPAKSEKQRKLMGAELGRKRAGKKTKTGMTEGQLREYTLKPKKKVKR